MRNLESEEKKQLASALSAVTKSGSSFATAFDLPQAQRDSIKKTIKETLGIEIQPRFETAPDLISGIELTTDGQKVAWSIADYLTSLQKIIEDLLKEQPKSEAKTEPEKDEQNHSSDKESMNMEPKNLKDILDNVFDEISKARESVTPKLTPQEFGRILTVSTGIANVSGLPAVGYDELIKFPGDLFGIAFNVDEKEIGTVLLGEYSHLHAGDQVERTRRVMDVAVGEELLGTSYRSAR